MLTFRIGSVSLCRLWAVSRKARARMAATMLLSKRITSPVGVVAPLVNGGCSMSDLKESYRVFKEKAQLITFQLLEQVPQ